MKHVLEESEERTFDTVSEREWYTHRERERCESREDARRPYFEGMYL